MERQELIDNFANAKSYFLRLLTQDSEASLTVPGPEGSGAGHLNRSRIPQRTRATTGILQGLPSTSHRTLNSITEPASRTCDLRVRAEDDYDG